jgi:hypothetical protein
MARRADTARIDTARRAAAIARLIGAGELPDQAEGWVARWERTSAPETRDRVAWERFDAWLAVERSAGRDPSGTIRTTGQGVAHRPGIDQPGRHEE